MDTTNSRGGCTTGGKYFELFDIVYSEMVLSEIMVRTFVHQLMTKLEEVAVAVIEPSDLLLDETMSLDIKTQSNRTIVNTYIAPELLLDDDNDYDAAKSAVFSVGVIAFILLTGRVPFEIATKDDPLYALIMNHNKRHFWSYFSDTDLSISVQSLLWNMLQSDPHKRCSVSDITKSEWFRHEVFIQYPNYNEIIAELKSTFNHKESQRAEDMANNEWISKTKKRNRFAVHKSLKIFPLHESEGTFDAYCNGTEIDTIYYGLAQFVETSLDGKVHFNANKQELMCMVKTQRDKIKFKIQVFESKRWKLIYDTTSGDGYSPLFVIRLIRIDGDCYEFIKIKNEHLLKWCGVLNGLSNAQKEAFCKFYGKRVKIDGSYYSF